MTKSLRCAVYTRKSTEEGLDQAFNTLHAQREACEAYVKSQAAEGWVLEKKHYDDGGYSGGTMDRPALQDLLRDIERGLVNVIVVYKIDRLSRSLADFARLVELFDSKRVTFVSVTQHFNTTTSMGRLTLNVLLSFAQFEREVTGERIRDKIAASKKKGMWMGGTVPMGYDARERRLVVNEVEAEHVRLIYQLYLELGTVRQLAEELQRRDIRSKVRTSDQRTKAGGFQFQRGQLYILLRNRTYIGEIAHRGNVYPGEHPAIVDRAIWEKAQALLGTNRRKDIGRRNGNPQYLLTGLLRDDRGNSMTPHHTQKKGAIRYAYYVSQALIQGRSKEAGTVPRVAVREIEMVVENATAPLLTPVQRDSWPALPAAQRRDLLASIVAKIELGDTRIRIELKKPDSGQCGVDSSEKSEIVIPFEARKRGGQTQIHAPAGIQEAVRSVYPAITSAMVRAWTWRQWFETGEASSLADVAKREACTEAYVRKLLPTAFLAPDLIEAAIQGTLPRHLKITDLARADMPLAWDAQRRLLGTVA